MASQIHQGNASGSGSVTIATPATNSNQVLTLPDETGTLYSSATPVRTQKGVPAFRAYQSTASVSITSNTFTKVTLNAEEFDVTSAFDSTTNYRFQPTVAGYYQISGAVNGTAASGMSRFLALIYKNGALYASCNDNVPATIIYGGANVSTVLYLNGSTDYVELWAYVTGTTISITGNNLNSTYMSGALIAAA